MDQKIILITGATTGIGRDTALHLAKKGHRVIATGRNVKALASLKAEAAGTELETLRLDVTDAQSIAAAKDAVDQMTSGYGIDVLVNNAGFGSAAPIVESPDSEVRSQYETNVFGLLAMVRTFVPQMMDRRSGRVVNVSSIGGRITMPLFGAYNSTKYAVESLSDAMRYELAPFGVKVSLIEPGPIKTEFSNTSVKGLAQYQSATSRYAQVFAKADQLKVKADAMSASPFVVTRAIEKAATSARPAIRYVMPFSSAIGVFFGRLMPTVLLDFVFRLATGLTPKMLAGTPARASVRPPRLLPAASIQAQA